MRNIGKIELLVLVVGIMFTVIGLITLLSHKQCAYARVRYNLLYHVYNLNNIKSKTVGDGQHGTARWASKSEINRIYKTVAYQPNIWRGVGNSAPISKKKKNRKIMSEKPNVPIPQGIVVGVHFSKLGNTALIDSSDVHCLIPISN